jgi:hypothetical protein
MSVVFLYCNLFLFRVLKCFPPPPLPHWESGPPTPSSNQDSATNINTHTVPLPLLEVYRLECVT